MADPVDKLEFYINAIAKTLPARVQQGLRMIGNANRELLALRRYVRKARRLDAQWVWSHDLDKSQAKQVEQVRAEIEKVKEKFEELNPGYTLGYSPIRDLKTQVRLWNGNKTVHVAAENINAKCLREIVDYPDLPDRDATERFGRFLGHCAVHPEPTSAAPGLSDHGQMHAVDFVVFQGGTMIAGTKTADNYRETHWDHPGWTKKLNDAVTLSKSKFESSPLKEPYEPWHYKMTH